MKIAVDGMGGDRAPAEIVAGVVLAAGRYPDVELSIFGDKERLRIEFDQRGGIPSTVSIVHTTQVVDMDDSPMDALRKKKDSSLLRAIESVKSGECDAIVSAGNTGALVGGATMRLRLLDGVKKCGIAVVMPTALPDRRFVLCDAGANINCRPVDLALYSIMSSIYAEKLGVTDKPSVSLLNIGDEDVKGNTLVKETRELLNYAEGLQFEGYTEGQDIWYGKTGCLVCDGFVGNSILKVSEGISGIVIDLFKKELKSSFRSRLGAALAKPAFNRVKMAINVAEWGGGVLLGLTKPTVKAHGGSDARVIAGAIRISTEFIMQNLNELMVESINRFNSARGKTDGD